MLDVRALHSVGKALSNSNTQYSSTSATLAYEQQEIDQLLWSAWEALKQKKLLKTCSLLGQLGNIEQAFT